MTPFPAPVILIDSREQTPLPFTRLRAERATLLTGDYSVKGLERSFSVERKSLDDLAGSLTAGRDRFTREMERLRGYEFRRLLIVGTRAQVEAHAYTSRATPAAILGSLAAWEIRYSVPVVFAPTPEAAAVEVERWAWYTARARPPAGT
jgi:DNA excision repair protein ERCC-4